MAAKGKLMYRKAFCKQYFQILRLSYEFGLELSWQLRQIGKHNKIHILVRI